MHGITTDWYRNKHDSKYVLLLDKLEMTRRTENMHECSIHRFVVVCSAEPGQQVHAGDRQLVSVGINCIII